MRIMRSHGRSVRVWILLALAGRLTLTPAQSPPQTPSLELTQRIPVPALSPDESLRTIHVADHLRVELIASEPIVQDPVAMAFDEDGRIWVVEMRGFMPDVHGAGEQEPVGRVSILEDTNDDGRMDQARIFLDGLVLPRAIAVVRGGALIAERHPLWFAEDTDRDSKADRKTEVDPSYGGSGMPEHSANGLWRGIDNWYYNAKSTFRYRQTNGQWTRSTTEFRGQWGISHDDRGRLFYNYNWSQLHADLVPPCYLSRNPNHRPSSGISVGVSTNQNIFPLRPTPAVNRGYIPEALDEQGRLRQFTSACAPLIYRGDALPHFSGNAFVCEPAGHLVKRNVLVEQPLGLSSRFGEHDSEFLASTDERFRPVFLSDGPDGALYIVDMYRGVIQHGAYMTSYLRKTALDRGLDQPIHLGRIYRVVPKNWSRPKPVRLSQANSRELIEMLSHPNGWRRDTAQRLLVERNDRSVLPQLRQLALHGTRPLGRLHALWTIEGLGHPAPAELLDALRDPDPMVQSAAVRVLELLSAQDASLQSTLASEWTRLLPRSTLEVRLQIALSSGQLPASFRSPILARVISDHADLPLVRDAVMSSLTKHEFTFLQELWADPAWHDEKPGRAVFLEMAAAAIIRGGDQPKVVELLNLLDRSAVDFGWRERAILAGLTLHADQRDFKPIQLPSQPQVLERLNQTDDRALRVRLEKLQRIFEWPGHKPAALPRAASRPLSGTEARLFAGGRQVYLTTCAGCHGTDGGGLLPLGPPLLDSPWVLGSPERLVRILLHGLEGPIEMNGTRWEAPTILPEMPSLAVLDNESLAAVLTYIRREWNHSGSPISPLTVSRIRTNTQGRQRPWTQPELEKTAENP